MRTFASFCFGLFLCLTASAAGPGGGGVDNGGQHLSLRFTQMGYEALSAMKKLSPAEAILTAPDLERFEIALMQTRVDAVPGPLLDVLHRVVDARFLEGAAAVIEIDQDRWPAILADADNVHRLVVHEYLRAMHLDDDNYKISAKLEEGVAKEILHGKPVLNPGSVGQQPIVDQLVDYFENADLPAPKDFIFPQNTANGSCFRAPDGSEGIGVQLKSVAHDNGPLFPPSYDIYFLNGASIVSAFSDSNLRPVEGSLVANILFQETEYATGNAEVRFRKKGNYLFLRIASQPTFKSDAPTLAAMCYFW